MFDLLREADCKRRVFINKRLVKAIFESRRMVFDLTRLTFSSVSKFFIE
jgi:hypothetical protein